MHTEKQTYSERADETLIDQIRKGDALAQEFLLDKYKAVVKSKTRPYFLMGADKEDILQEGMIGLYKAVRDYQPEKNISFRSFAELCINRQIYTAIKSAARQKHMPLNSYVSLNKPVFEEDQEGSLLDLLKEEAVSNPETLVIGQESRNFIEAHMNDSLTALEMKVLKYHLDGKNYEEIAALIGRPEKSVDNALQRIKKKLEKFIAEKKS